MNEYSEHAKKRAQQRRIPQVVVDIIRKFGRTTRRYHADVFFMDKLGRKRVRSYLGKQIYDQIKRYLDIYVVVADDGSVITVAHRLTRIG